MIDKFILRQRFHNVAVKITLADNSVLFGCIVKDENDYCHFVKTSDINKYNQTNDVSLIKKIEIKKIKDIDYQIP